MSPLRRGLISWFVHNPVAATLLTLFILAGGAYSALTIGKQYEPAQQSKLISITTQFPGASPQEVEEAVLARLEEAIRMLPQIRHYTSQAQYGVGVLTLEAKDPAGLPQLMDEVQLRIQSISSLPRQAEKPVIEIVRNWRRVMFVQIYGDMDQSTIKEVTKQVRDELAALPGMGRVQLPWMSRYEVSIEVAPAALHKYQLSLADIATQVEQASGNIGAGLLRSSAGDMQIRAAAQAYQPEQFAAIVLRQFPDGRQLKLGDVATIRDTFEEKGAFFGYNGKPGEVISVESIDDQNDLAIASEVRNYLQQKSQQLPASVKLDIWSDNSAQLAGRLGMLASNLLSGAVLIFIFLSLFLQVRTALWVVVSLLTCCAATLTLIQLPLFGQLTINMYSLFGFLLVLGILVDDAIVVSESVMAHAEHSGRLDAASVIRGTRKVALPGTVGVLTTILAFVPLLFLQGELAVMWYTIGVVVITALAVSVLDSKLLLPAHLAAARDNRLPPQSRPARALLQLRDRYYRPLLQRVLHWRWPLLCTTFSLMLICAASLSSGYIRTLLWPAIPSDYIQVNLQGEYGLPNQQMHQLVLQITGQLSELDRSLEQELGQPVVRNQLYWRQGDSGAGIYVELVPAEQRDISTSELIRRWRALIGQPAGLRQLSMDAASSSAGPDVSLNLTAASSDTLQQAAAAIRSELASVSGVTDLYDSLQSGSEQIELMLKPVAVPLGFSLAEVATQVRAAIYGIEIQRLVKNAEETKVMLRYPSHLRREISHLQQLQLKVPGGGLVPFAQVADFRLVAGLARIDRMNGQRALTVHAYVDKSRTSPEQVLATLTNQIVPQVRQQFPDLQTSLQGASRETDSMLHQLAMAALLVLALMYAAIAIPTGSFSRPLIIMAVLPCAVAGAVLGHWLMALELSLLSLLGMIALCGVVVNDSILLLDNLASQNASLPLSQRLQQAAAARFRPCLITSVTTMLGLFPVVFESSQQAQFVIPMAVSICFGLLVSTVITLFLSPALLLALDDIRQVWSARQPATVQPFTLEHSDEKQRT